MSIGDCPHYPQCGHQTTVECDANMADVRIVPATQDRRDTITALVESARLLGLTQAKKTYGVYVPLDALSEVASYESIERHSKTLLTVTKQPAADGEKQHHEALQRIGTALGLLPGANLHTECVPVIEQLIAASPIDMVLHCPACGLQHIDKPHFPDVHDHFDAPCKNMTPPEEYEERIKGMQQWEVNNPPWTNPQHRSHLCHGCGHIWRPADVATNGVEAVKTTGKADSPITAQPATQTPKPEISPSIKAMIATATKGDDTEWRGFAVEMALQYGFTMVGDDENPQMQVGMDDLVNMMAVLGYRRPSVFLPRAKTSPVDPSDIKIETYRSLPGWMQGTSAGVRLTHIPTGISAECITERSQYANRAIALEELDRKLLGHKNDEATASPYTLCPKCGHRQSDVARCTRAACPVVAAGKATS